MNAGWHDAIAARPTTYRGRRYRSRLEARWAAFFDALGWRYEYEPFDLRGWVPDFVLIGAKADILVEVKPITRFDWEIANKIKRALSEGQEALLVGCCLPQVDGFDFLGYLARWKEPAETGSTRECVWDMAAFAWYKSKPEFADFTHGPKPGPFAGRLTGEPGGDRWGDAPPRDHEINEAWGHAAAMVQWIAESRR